MVREIKRGEVTSKDMSVYKEADVVKAQKDKGRGTLRDYSLKHRVTIQWDLNQEAIDDQMFKLIVDDYEVILDLEELLRYTRWI